ncbi:hypothetical protein M0804_013511 [Polistes exclamans]|nr:hypothetical protein M0804_013511 [Polistes exclamans]
MVEKTSGKAVGTLVDEIQNHIEAVFDSIAEEEFIVNRIDSVATQDTNLPTASLLSSVSTTVSSLSIHSIYRIPAVQ